MPKKVDEIHDALIEDPNFYPEKSEKEQESLAWAIAWSKYNKSNKKKKKKSKRKSFIEKLNKVITALEDNGYIKEADVLHNVFIKVSQNLNNKV